MKLLKAFLGLFVGVAMVATAVYYSSKKDDDIGKEIKRPPSKTELLNKSYNVNLIDDFGKDVPEQLIIKAELDKKTNTLYFGNYTQDYNRKNWEGDEKELIPTYARHIQINPVYSKMFILHPKNVKVSAIEQKAYLVPQYGWDNKMKPYEEHEEAQLAIRGGEEIIDWSFSKIPIPFFKDFIEKGLEADNEREEKKYKELFKKIKEGYTATIIPSYITNKIYGHTTTAREYKIKFNTTGINSDTPIYLWAKVALGDPSKASHGSFPNKYGDVDDILIPFILENMRKQDNVYKTTMKPLRKRKIAYHYEGEIYLINEDGTERVNITNTPNLEERVNNWSPDGNKIAINVGKKGPRSRRTNLHYLGYIDLVKNETKLITQKGSESNRHAYATWSPDSNYIAMKRWSGGGHGDCISIYNLKNGNDQIVYLGGSPGNISFTSKGKIVLNDFLRGGEHEIMTLDIDGYFFHPQEDGRGWKRLTYNPDNDSNIAWLLKEDKILFKSVKTIGSSKKKTPLLYTMNIDGTEVKKYNSAQPVKYKLTDYSGKRVSGKVFLVGTKIYSIQSGFIENASASPEGDRIAYTECKENVCSSTIYTIDTDGKNKRELTKGWGARWQPNIR